MRNKIKTVNYMFLSTPRTGSTLLFYLLKKNKLAAQKPKQDHFEPFHDSLLLNLNFEGLDLKSFIEKQLKQYEVILDNNKIRGFKILYNQISLFIQLYNNCNKEKITPKDFFNYFPKDTKYIFIKRENKFMQAISLFKASQSKQWLHKVDQKKKRWFLFNYWHIKSNLQNIESEEANLQRLQEDFFKDALILTYEVFSIDLKDTILKISNYFDINLKKVNYDIDLKVQRDIHSQLLRYIFIPIHLLDSKSNSDKLFWVFIFYVLHKMYKYTKFLLQNTYVIRIIEHKSLRETINQEVEKYHKISFCITCMDRLPHIKKTLKKNILDNINYPNVEFVLLDYNSKDGLKEWVFKNLGEYLYSGKLVYCQTKEPEYFDMSKAKNLAHRYATGDVVCNLDADNYTRKDFAFYINSVFSKNNNIIGRRSKIIDLLGERTEGTDGRLFLSKKNFEKLGGYDESFIGWGAEDDDLYERATELGLKPITIPLYFMQAIKHNENLRTKRMQFKDIVYSSDNNNEKIRIKNIANETYHVEAEYFNQENIVLHKPRILYLPIPKVATTSIKKTIQEYIVNENNLNKDIERDPHFCDYPFVWKKNILKNYSNYFRFTFVRNPWDRILSCYLNRIRKDDITDNIFKVGVFRDFEKKYPGKFKSGMSFSDFVKVIAKIPDRKSDDHFKSQYLFITDKKGNLLANFIGRFENIDKDFEIIKLKLGLLKDIKLNHLMKSKDHKYKEYYTQETSDIIARRYKKDIKLFNYKFEE